MDNEKVYKPSEVAEQFSCSERMVLNLIYGGDLEAFRIGNRYRITESAVKDYLSKNTVRKGEQNNDERNEQ